MITSDNNNKNIWNRILRWGLLIICVLGLVYFLIGRKNLSYLSYTEFEGSTPESALTDLDKGVEVRQSYMSHADRLLGVTLQFGTYDRTPSQGEVHISVSDENGELAEAVLDVSVIRNNQPVDIVFSGPVGLQRNRIYSVTVWADGLEADQSLAVYGTDRLPDSELWIDGNLNEERSLYFSPAEERYGNFELLFGTSLAGIAAAFVIVCLASRKNAAEGKSTPLVEMAHIFDRYQFLLKELVDQEFAIRYRRSYLGVLWVVLNPLITMVIMSFIFSNIFRSNVENFPVYFILGQITFNFFNESTTTALSSVLDSSAMLKKIYIPKYIFPISKVMFSFVNYLITFIPAFAVMLFYRVWPGINMVYLPMFFISLFLFVLGIGFLLCAMMVFMRDVRYLYGIVTSLLAFLTPIFYSIDNFHGNARRIMSLNPLYQYISVLRTILLNRSTPTVGQMDLCLAMGVVSFIIGSAYFFRKQDRFILYL